MFLGERGLKCRYRQQACPGSLKTLSLFLYWSLARSLNFISVFFFLLINTLFRVTPLLAFPGNKPWCSTRVRRHDEGNVNSWISNLLRQKQPGMARRNSIDSCGDYSTISGWPINSLNHYFISCVKILLSCVTQWSEDVSGSYPFTQRIEIKVHTDLWKGLYLKGPLFKANR